MLAGVLALPAPWALRLRVLARDLPLLFALNLLPILALLYTMARHPESNTSLARSQGSLSISSTEQRQD